MGSDIKGFTANLDNTTREDIAQIICDVFHLRTDYVFKIISNINRWGDSYYQSPDYTRFGTNPALIEDDAEFGIIKETPFTSLDDPFSIWKSDVFTNMISETYARAILYFRIAAHLELNYHPDSIRVPIIAYLNKIVLKGINRLGSELIMTADSALKKEIESIDPNHFVIDIPWALGMIIKSCIETNESTEKFITKAIELRDSKKIKNFRDWLAEVEIALNNDLNKYKKMKKEAESIFESKKYDVKDTTLAIGPSGPSIANIPIGLFSEPIERLKSFFFRKKRRLILLHDISKDLNLIAKDEDVRRFLGKLSDREIQAFKELNAYRRGYLKKIFTKKISA